MILRRVLALLCVPLVLATLGAVFASGPGEGAAPAVTAAPGAIPDRLCLTCHKGMALEGVAHGVLGKTMPQETCTACHGDPGKHLEDPWENGIQKGASAAEKAALCLKCHVRGPDHVVAWAESTFAKDGRTCADCHAPHTRSEARLTFEGDAEGYLADSQCRMCHQPLYRTFESTFHARVIDQPGGGCEACHGPGQDHANGAIELAKGTGPANIAKAPSADRCLLCHRAMPERHAREMPVYAEKRPACTVCHDVHVDRSDPLWADGGTPPPSAGQKAGSAACATCHGLAVESAKTSVHAGVFAEAEKGCEACHGPALAHVKSGGRSRFIVNPLSGTPEQASDLCLGCHLGAPDHARDWKGGALAASGLSCLTCHEAHALREGQGRPRVPEGTPAVKGRTLGNETCAVCHSSPHPGIEGSPHAALVSDPKAAGCEACHGPGSEHVMKGGAPEAIRNPARLPAEQRAGFCLECHGRATTMFGWDHGAHSGAGLSCQLCHEPLKPAAGRSRKEQPELCFSCHGEVRASFNLPNRHPLDRDAVRCSDCHQVHGEAKGLLGVAAKKERCTACHEAQRGPFLYEHDADATDGCTVCHQPHGSVNRRLLTHRNVRDLCITCHTVPASHSQSAGSAFLSCLNCHGSIHGSYSDSHLFR